jgi:2-polyprenyl-6-methoxyphenol hydroxylase-like FAD-dependent oxidoreductase
VILSEQHTPVLIVGAGPSGLMMAAQLLRYGVQPIIIDNKQGPTDESKALAVQARSLEIYRQMGLIDRVLAGGKHAEGISFMLDGKNIASLSFANVGEGQTAYPFVHLYPQSKNEKLLLDFLTHHVCPVYWETSLISFKLLEKGVAATLHQAGRTIALSSDWVIGADGAHSTVRKQLKIPFSGNTYASEFYLADVELDNPELDDDLVHLCLGKKGFAGFFPMPEGKRYRLIGNLPERLTKTESLKLEDVLPYLQDISGISAQIKQNFWFTTYRLHHRMADKFREQRCFLIGDAAHIHSPVGGQGMNTGLQDAYNLAWKLAGVVNSRLKESMLESYAAERTPVAKTLLDTTDRLFNIAMSNKWYARLFKASLMPVILKFAWNNKSIREELFKRVSQIDINYRNSAISLQICQSKKIMAGDRLPYLKVFDEKKQEETDLQAWCSKPGFTFIVLGKLAESDLFTLAKWITQNYSLLLNFFYLPPSAKNLHIFEAFEVNPNRVRSLIIRPDLHIGFLNDKVDMVLMDNYLRNVVGVVV